MCTYFSYLELSALIYAHSALHFPVCVTKLLPQQPASHVQSLKFLLNVCEGLKLLPKEKSFDPLFNLFKRRVFRALLNTSHNFDVIFGNDPDRVHIIK